MTIDWTAVGSIATAVGSVTTAIAVLFAGQELKHTKQQAQSGFEDQLEREYRDIVAQLPVAALLGEALPGPLPDPALTAFYRYIDLTNQQIFLRQHSRIGQATWMSWREGIAHNLRRPAFAAAWAHIKEAAPEDFDELRRLEKSGFAAEDDPVDWPDAPAIDASGPMASRQPASHAVGSPPNGQRP